jgi:multidrug efflux pump
LVLLIGLGVACSGYFFFSGLQSELAPFEDQGTLLGGLKGPEGATIGYVDRYARQAEQIIATVPEVDRSFVLAGVPDPNQGRFFAPLKPWSERERTQRQIAESITPAMAAIPGVNAVIIQPPPLGRGFREVPINVVIQTTRSYDELQQMMTKLMDRVSRIPGIVNPDSDLQLNTPQLRIQVDRDKAADLGISGDVIGRTLETMLGGRQVTRFKREGKQYDVIVQVADSYRASPSDVPRLYVRSVDGGLVQLGNLVHLEERVAASELNHFNQLRAATLTANLAPGAGLGDVLTQIGRAAHEVLPADAQIDYGGLSREYKNASSGIYMTFVLALAFIYLVLSAQFESFRSPFIIMLTVPLSISGGLMALWLDGSTLNIYSQVGLVTLIGLITKHGILIVEFANQNRRHGMDKVRAVREAAVVRLRPILMTTGAMVFGALPLSVATGAGAESRQDIGLVIVGGLLVGTLFTLFVIPAVYTYLVGAKVAAEHHEIAAQPAE